MPVPDEDIQPGLHILYSVDEENQMDEGPPRQGAERHISSISSRKDELEKGAEISEIHGRSSIHGLGAAALAQDRAEIGRYVSLFQPSVFIRRRLGGGF